MAFVAKELGRLVAGLGQRAKGAPRSIAVEDVAGGPFFSTPAEAERVMPEALVVLCKVAVARSFCEEVQCWAWEGELRGRSFTREIPSCVRRGGVSYPPSGEEGLALPLHGALEMRQGHGAAVSVGMLGSPELGLGVRGLVAGDIFVPRRPLYGGRGGAYPGDRVVEGQEVGL